MSAIKNEGINLGLEPTYILIEETIAKLWIENCWCGACPLTFKDQNCNNKKLTYIEDGVCNC